MRLLFVCTGNVCRSPVAAGLASAWVARTAGGEAADVEIISAGTNAPLGRPLDPHSAAALSRLGGARAEHTARGLTQDVAAHADLVLTMTREHRRTVLGLAPRGLRRTFTLLEAADLLRSVEVRDLARLPLELRAAELGRRLDAARAHRATSSADDIDDPIGRRASVHDSVADTIDVALRPLLSALFPAPARRAVPPLPTGIHLGV